MCTSSPVAAEARIRLHVHGHVEIAGRGAARARIALAGEAQPFAVVDARPATATASDSVRIAMPAPPQAGQATKLAAPVPSQRGQALRNTMWPRAVRTVPVPPHPGHGTPGACSRPSPAQPPQRPRRVTAKRAVTPSTTAVNGISQVGVEIGAAILVGDRRCGGADDVGEEIAERRRVRALGPGP